MLCNQQPDHAVLLTAIAELQDIYQGFSWESQIWAECGARRSPYRALILFGLSARTKDRQLVEIGGLFFQRFPDPKSLLAAWPETNQTLEGIVRLGQLPFVGSAVRVMGENGPGVPRDQPHLRQITGVGEKIAECVTAYGWGEEALPLDGNACRVVSRVWGLAFGGRDSHAGYLRGELKSMYRSHRQWMCDRGLAMIDLHELLRLHGQQVCTRIPQCYRCPVAVCHFRRHAWVGADKPAASAALWQEWRDLLLDPVGSEGD